MRGTQYMVVWGGTMIDGSRGQLIESDEFNTFWGAKRAMKRLLGKTVREVSAVDGLFFCEDRTPQNSVLDGATIEFFNDAVGGFKWKDFDRKGRLIGVEAA